MLVSPFRFEHELHDGNSNVHNNPNNKWGDKWGDNSNTTFTMKPNSKFSFGSISLTPITSKDHQTDSSHPLYKEPTHFSNTNITPISFKIPNKLPPKIIKSSITSNSNSIDHTNNYPEQLFHFQALSDTISLIIQPPNGKPTLHSTVSSQLVRHFKRTISSNYRLHGWRFKIYIDAFKTKSLEHDDCTLDEYGIKDQQTLYLELVNKSVEIKAIWGKTMTFTDLDPAQSILDLKIKIQKSAGIYHLHQRLLYNNKEIPNTVQIKDINVTLHLILKYPHLRHFNALLCNHDISVPQTPGILYKNMINQWRNSCNMKNGDSLKLEAVYKICKNYQQNLDIYNALMMLNKNGKSENQRILFHGTSLENVKRIMNTGFNRDYNVNSVYGKGTYFSNKARIAAKYCEKMEKKFEADKTIYVMLGCLTYIGEYTVGSLNMNDSSLFMDDCVTQYDSLVNRLDNPSIFVINRDYHSVPCFIIVYSRQNNGNNQFY